MKNTKEIGQELEYYILEKIKELDPTARLSRGSGCGNDIADINNNIFYVECKKRNTESISIKESIWNHMVNQLPISTKKIPIMALENKNKKRWIVIESDEFFRILKAKYEDFAA